MGNVLKKNRALLFALPVALILSLLFIRRQSK